MRIILFRFLFFVVSKRFLTIDFLQNVVKNPCHFVKVVLE